MEQGRKTAAAVVSLPPLLTCNEYERVSDPVHMQFTPIDEGGGPLAVVGLPRRLLPAFLFATEYNTIRT